MPAFQVQIVFLFHFTISSLQTFISCRILFSSSRALKLRRLWVLAGNMPGSIHCIEDETVAAVPWILILNYILAKSLQA